MRSGNWTRAVAGIELGLQAPGLPLSGWLITALDQGEEPEVAGHAPRQRCVLMIGAATHGIVGSRNS